MDIHKELQAFRAVAISNDWDIDGETTPSGFRFYSLKTNTAWEGWQAKAQAVPEGFGDIQSWIAVNSFSALDASIVDFPVVDANELAEFIDSLNIDVAVPEGFVLVKKDHLSEAVKKIELMFEEDSTLALGELLPIQQGIKALIEAQEPTND